MRECGDCEECCRVGAVDDPLLQKPAHTKCPNQTGHGCAIYSQTRAVVCGSFQCSWLRGYGEEEDRPDKVGALVSVNTFNGGKWVLAIETKPNALMTSASSLVRSVAGKVHLPVIVVNSDSRPPNDTGDRVVVQDGLLPRSSQLVGSKLGELSGGFGVYNLLSS